MTAPNGIAVQKCITDALLNAGITAAALDAINGHLTATAKDAFEIENWCQALNLKGKDFPYINSLKSMVGHCLSAAGSIECVASILQLHHDFIFPNTNCEDLNPDILNWITAAQIPQRLVHKKMQYIAKASFGFGDVNACIIFKKWNSI
jgi:3-oxoacyl-(acyl-carrier-protein) synthase